MLALCVCVGMFILGVVSIVVFVFCTLLLLTENQYEWTPCLKITITMVNMPVYINILPIVN